MSLPEDYRDYFIRNLHDALSGHVSSNVDEAVKYSERSRTKCIGITIETRPDYCLKKHLSDMLRYGYVDLRIFCEKKFLISVVRRLKRKIVSGVLAWRSVCNLFTKT